MFKTGQKVVCIDNSSFKGTGENSGLQLNEIYSIRSVHDGGTLCFINESIGEFLCSRFREVDNGFAEEILERIKQEIEHEQLILA